MRWQASLVLLAALVTTPAAAPPWKFPSGFCRKPPLELQGECEEVNGCLCVCFALPGKNSSALQVYTAYAGELGYELILVLPYLNYLHSRGVPIHTQGAPGSEPWYFFSPDHAEVKLQRSYCPGPYSHPDAHATKAGFKFDSWLPPDYKAHYGKQGFLPEPQNVTGSPQAAWWLARRDKPLLVVHNKYTEEWNNPPVNFLDVTTLLELFRLLTPHFACVYIRPHSGQHLPGYSFDKSGTLEFGDNEAIKSEFPQVAILGELLQAHAPELPFNTAQLRLHAQADYYISVLGGNAVIASYFAKTNLIFAVQGHEVKNAFEYGELYAKVSPGGAAKIVPVSSYEALLKAAREHLVPAAPPS